MTDISNSPDNPFGDEPISNPFGDEIVSGSEAEFIAQRANPNRGVGPLQAFAISFGRGLTNIGRGLGIADEEPQTTSSVFQQLQRGRPISTTVGEIGGEIAPFLPAGVGVGAIQGMGGRIAASGLLGAIEGALISRGQGADIDDAAKTAGISGLAAGTLEAIFPHISRIGGALVRRVRGSQPRGPLFTNEGIPTPELQSALDESGITLEELADDAIKTLEGAAKDGSSPDPEQLVRASRFNQLGIEPTRGNVTQNFNDIAQEERLVSMASGETGEPLRQRRLQQSQAFAEGINSMVDELGVPGEAGEKIRLALTGQLQDLKSQKNELYKSVAEISPQVAEMPLFTDTIAEALPTQAELRRASRLQGNNVAALQDLLVEFGIDTSEQAVNEFVRSGGEVMPLSVGNIEEFRQALNQLRGGTSPGERLTAQYVGDVIKALDGEADIIDSALQSANITDRSLLAPIKQARDIVRRIKTDFSEQDIVGRIVGVKRDGVTPLIEASKITGQLVSPSTPIEKLERTIKALQQSGPAGRAAQGDLQASVIIGALDDALRAPSRNTSGVQTIGYSQFIRSLDKIGEDRLKLIFSSNPQALAQVNTFRQAAQDLTPPAMATPRGSAPVIMDYLNRMGQIPGIAAIRDVVNFVVRAGADERAVRRAFNNNPEMKRIASDIEQNFPSLASAMGISVMIGDEE